MAQMPDVWNTRFVYHVEVPWEGLTTQTDWLARRKLVENEDFAGGLKSGSTRIMVYAFLSLDNATAFAKRFESQVKDASK